MTINYEGVPRVVEDVSWRRTGRVRRGPEIREPILTTVRFQYPSTASPLVAARAAVTAFNAMPHAEARYQVVEAAGMLDFVPVEVLTVDGRYVPYRPLLDTLVTLDSPVGTPTELYRAIVAGLRDAAGVPITDTLGDRLLGSAIHDLTLPVRQGSARLLLDLVIATADPPTSWMLIWNPNPAVGAVGWVVGLHERRAHDETTLNGTPLRDVSVPAPQRPDGRRTR